MPPGLLMMPSPAMSVLKQYLDHHDFEVSIHYLNLRFVQLQCAFLWTKDISTLNDEKNSLFIFLNFLAINERDKEGYNNVKARLLNLKPEYITLGSDFFDKHMNEYAQKLDILIDEIISDIYSPDILCYGFSVSLYQWICVSIIAKKMKSLHPDCIIVIGGIGNEYTAISYLENFPEFDFAFWGEGEDAFLKFCKKMKFNNHIFEEVPNIAYRKDGKIITTKNKEINYKNLSDLTIRPDYSDYMSQITNYSTLNILPGLGIEASRGCHWRRCHFCYLNTGYKYRIKSIRAILDEIVFYIEKCNIYRFRFLDNDLIGNDTERFNLLLDELIKIKELYSCFEIDLAEIITLSVNSMVIRKMKLAGFVNLQIGYESSSDGLLKKINKKNTFASNFLVIKFATIYRIRISGANIIMGLLEETDAHIMEAIANLHYLRFYLNNNIFKHEMTVLQITHSSPYYNKVKNNRSEWKTNPFFKQYLPSGYLQNDLDADIISLIPIATNPLWDSFIQLEDYYRKSLFEYELLNTTDSIMYRELLNGNVITEFEFSALDWFILQVANDSVVSIEQMLYAIENSLEEKYLEIEIINILEELREEKLLYISDDYSEIVSVINTKLVL
jgi:radical SAM superfamily enzyme YgiQ (UPF0313 family)